MDVRRVNEILRRIARNLAIWTPPQTVRYRDFNFALETDGDRVLGDKPLLTLGGVRWFSSDALELSGDLRVHLGPASVRDLIELLRNLQ